MTNSVWPLGCPLRMLPLFLLKSVKFSLDPECLAPHKGHMHLFSLANHQASRTHCKIEVAQWNMCVIDVHLKQHGAMQVVQGQAQAPERLMSRNLQSLSSKQLARKLLWQLPR